MTTITCAVRVGRLAAAFALVVGIAAVRAASAADGIVCLADGRQLHYSEYGDPNGPLVLFFHGTPGSSRDAAIVQQNILAAGIRLITPDRPGIGRSSYQPGRRILDWPADIDQLVAAVAAPGARFSIFAMSGGTPYALACARAFPDRIDQVIIASGYAPPEADAPKTEVNRSLSFIDRRPRLARLGVGLVGRKLDRNPDKALQLVAKAWSETDRRLVECSPQLKRDVIATLREATLCGPDGVLHDARLLSACWGFQVDEAASVPIAIFHGHDDEVAPVQMAHWLHAHLPGSELTVFPCSGHLSTLIWRIDQILSRIAFAGGMAPAVPTDGPMLAPTPTPADAAVEVVPVPALQ